MDLYAIAVVGCCANLPSTNGTAELCRSISWYQSKALNEQIFPFGHPCEVIFLSVPPTKHCIHRQNQQNEKSNRTTHKKAVDERGCITVKYKNLIWILLLKKIKPLALLLFFFNLPLCCLFFFFFFVLRLVIYHLHLVFQSCPLSAVVTLRSPPVWWGSWKMQLQSEFSRRRGTMAAKRQSLTKGPVGDFQMSLCASPAFENQTPLFYEQENKFKDFEVRCNRNATLSNVSLFITAWVRTPRYVYFIYFFYVSVETSTGQPLLLKNAIPNFPGRLKALLSEVSRLPTDAFPK